MPNQSQSDAYDEAKRWLEQWDAIPADTRKIMLVHADFVHEVCSALVAAAPPSSEPTRAEIATYRDTFRAELDKRMDTKHPSSSPSTEAHEIALRQFVRNRAFVRNDTQRSEGDGLDASMEASRRYAAMLKAPVSERAAKAYADKNPLGGPAVMFEAMAERIRAGEDYYAVLADYSLAHVPNGGSAKVPEGWKLVPVEPTPEMFGAGYLTANKVKRAVGLGHCDHIMTDSLCVAIYRAMLAAARTSQPGAEGPGPDQCNDLIGKPGHYRGDRK